MDVKLVCGGFIVVDDAGCDCIVPDFETQFSREIWEDVEDSSVFLGAEDLLVYK